MPGSAEGREDDEYAKRISAEDLPDQRKEWRIEMTNMMKRWGVRKMESHRERHGSHYRMIGFVLSAEQLKRSLKNRAK